MRYQTLISASARPTASPHAQLANCAVFGLPDEAWVFVEADTLAWKQWRRFCLREIGRAPAAAFVFASPPGRTPGRYRGRSLPMLRPPGESALDRMRIASGERDDDEVAT
ncbi:hypothetical protein [Ancylobacter rudongensis]|uniref:Uncharacterized protein n=1 Tax=Ancylobacter rudongensis TaxID=177413 RepID=A0A1G4PNU7_9HYPH|nr:hypothetical protein [Ancylobacter rudongensis]SCW34014.1 hypothetical protein SAMN05660859_0683 [Ancylobacter rudongensis]